MEKHFASYGDAVRATIPEGYEEFARVTPTGNPAKWPTIFSYLAACRRQIDTALLGGDWRLYEGALVQHQKSMIMMCERMVDRELEAVPEVTAYTMLDVLSRLGWRWFRYGPMPVLLDVARDNGTTETVHVIPRYTERFVSYVPKGVRSMDAEEAELLRIRGKDFTDHVFGLKDGDRELKLAPDKHTGPNATAVLPWHAYNMHEGVYDWTLPLFPQEGDAS